jgi:transposase
MSESLRFDSPFRGWAMPKSYSGDLRERVIEAVEMGASRHEAAERFEVSVSSTVKWLQRWRESRNAAPKPRGGSVSPLEKCAAQVSAVIAGHPDLTLMETVAELRKRRIRTSKSALSRFFGRHDITPQKKACKRRNGSEQTWLARVDAGSGSKACLTPLAWCSSTRLRSAPIWCGSGGGPRGASG